MSDARILEKVHRRSRRAGYSDGARSDHEDLGKGWTSPTGRLSSVSSQKLNNVLVSWPCTKRQVTQKQKRLLKELEKLPPIGCYGRRLCPCEGTLTLILKQ